MSNYLLFRNLGHAGSSQLKKLMIIFGTIGLIFLVVAGFFYIKDFLVEKNWYKTDAVVSKFDISNSSNVWTELKYEYDDEDYKTKIDGHSYYMTKGSEVEVYVDTDNPDNIKAARHLYAIAKPLFIGAGVFLGIVLILILPIYIGKKRKGK